jgi:hypothetical protein
MINVARAPRMLPACRAWPGAALFAGAGLAWAQADVAGGSAPLLVSVVFACGR